ncbi:MAG: CP12 domain-containing protein [Cyanobacteriota bacterium]|nr:CP12 domain-containing protein [Cyanobacteriota bacterium]
MAKIKPDRNARRVELAAAESKGDQAVARKLEQRIQELEAYQQRHPEAAEAPSPLEVFCDLNPSNINCRVYDD